MRWLAALCAAFLALLGLSPVAAQNVEPGLYEGTIGKLPIRVCFDESSINAGTYYYLKHLKPIALRKGEGEDPDVLTEFTGYEERTGGQWLSLRQTGETLSGIWRDGRRRLSIRLKQVLFTGGEFAGPCESKQFLLPRMAGASIKESAADFSGTPLTNLEFVPGPNFDAESVMISSFVLADPAQPGDRAINAALRRVLPIGVDDSDSGFLECMGMMNMSWGWDGNFEHSAQPEVLTARWLGVVHFNGVYCGGAHPSFWQSRQIFDRQSGAEVDPAAWLRKGALRFYEYEDPEGYYPKRPVAGLDDDLFRAVRRYWPREADDECTAVIEERWGGWDIGLGQGGLIFRPELPHVVTACVESVTVPWADLEPFLSDEGAAVRASLMP